MHWAAEDVKQHGDNEDQRVEDRRDASIPECLREGKQSHRISDHIGVYGPEFLDKATEELGLPDILSRENPDEVEMAPVEVASQEVTGQVAQLGIMPLLKFAAFLSINLGLINLLPVPVLDGGHIVTLAIEAVRGKPLSRDKLQWIQMVGFTLLMLLFLLATYKDLSRLKLF